MKGASASVHASLWLLLFVSVASAQTTSPTPAPVASKEPIADEAPIELTKFSVTATQDRGYLSTHSVGGTRTNTALKDIPQKISIINSELIADSASTTALEATRFVANVQSSDFRSDGFRIRGLEAGQTTINGFNVNATVQNELSHIDRIEVMKGPAGVLYGTGRFGGVINLVRKQPLAKVAYELKAQYRDAGSLRLEGDFSGPVWEKGDVKLLYRFTGAYQDGDQFFDYSHWNRTAYSPTVQLLLGQNTRITAYYEYLEDDRTNYWGDHLGRNSAGVFNVFLNPDRRVNFRPGAYRWTKNETYSFQVEHRFSEHFTARASTLYFDGLHGDSGGGGHRMLADNRTIHLYTDHQLFSHVRARTQFDFLSEFSLGPTKHNMLVGTEFTHENWDTSENWQPRAQVNDRNGNPWQVIDILNPRATPPRDATFNAMIDPVKVRNIIPPKNISLFDAPTNYYFQDQMKAFNDRLVVTAGLRWDEITNTTVNPFTNLVESNVQKKYSPRYGFVYNLTPTVGVYAVRSEGFQPQSGYDFYTGKPIAPTTGEVTEGGFKLNLLNGQVVGTLSYFVQTQNDIVSTVFNTNVGTFESVGVTQGGVWQSKGYEADLVISPSENWQIIASFGVADPRVKEDTDPRNVGKRFENAPDMTWSVWSKYKFVDGTFKNLSLGGGVSHSSEKAGDRANNFFVPGFERVDLFASYRYGKNLTFSVNVNNVFDKYYYAESRAYRDLIFGDPRNFTFTVTTRF